MMTRLLNFMLQKFLHPENLEKGHIILVDEIGAFKKIKTLLILGKEARYTCCISGMMT